MSTLQSHAVRTVASARDAHADRSTSQPSAAPTRRRIVVGRTAGDALIADVITGLEIEFDVEQSSDGKELLRWIVEERPALIILPMQMNGVSGLDVVRRIPQGGFATRAPVLALAAEHDVRAQVLRTHGLADRILSMSAEPGEVIAGAWQLLDEAVERSWKKLDPALRDLLGTARAAFDDILAAATLKRPLETTVVRKCTQSIVAAARAGNLVSAISALKNHHDSTYVHSVHVAAAMTAFGIHVGVSDAEANRLAEAGLMHDIGKNMIPLAILNKPGKLDAAEAEIMMDHSVLSANALRQMDSVSPDSIFVAERHHEKLDGTGYPYGLNARSLDDMSLMSSVCDVYSALTEKRAYKPMYSDAEAFRLMDRMVGNHLEKAFYTTFRAMVLDGQS